MERIVKTCNNVYVPIRNIDYWEICKATSEFNGEESFAVFLNIGDNQIPLNSYDDEKELSLRLAEMLKDFMQGEDVTRELVKKYAKIAVQDTEYEEDEMIYFSGSHWVVWKDFAYNKTALTSDLKKNGYVNEFKWEKDVLDISHIIWIVMNIIMEENKEIVKELAENKTE